MKKLIAGIACFFAVLVGGLAYNPPSAAADVSVHAWNTTPLEPFTFFRHPVGVTQFTTGQYTNATLVATCVLKLRGDSQWRGDGCDFDWFDVDHTGTDDCWYNRSQRRWIGYFVTQSLLVVHHDNGQLEPVSLYSEPVELTCYGGKATLEAE